MNGNRIFADTNILLYLLDGDEILSEFLNNKKVYISFITQLEVLGYKMFTRNELKVIENLVSECTIIDINSSIKNNVIELRRNYRIKLPDSIIIATSFYLDLPIISADKDFKKIESLPLIFYERGV